MNVDYLIIGQGIAGSVLSFSLMEAGSKVMVLGKQGLTVSSEVAAGLFNPVTGRKMVKTWNADAVFSHIEPVYRRMEQLSGAEFLFSVPIYRPFTDTAEQNDWYGKQAEPAYANYIKEVFDKPQQLPHVKNPYGGILLQQAGWLDIPAMLLAWRNYLLAENSFREETFEEDSLQVYEDGISYKDIKAKKIIYCNGNRILNSRYWSWVPLRPVKGEVLLLKSGVELEWIINRGVFLLPLGNGTWKLGSTYDQRDLSLSPTEAAKQDMLERLQSLVDIPFEVIGHRAGIRPATKDRRPVAGTHPKHKPLLIFNGLGTKGVSLAPYCAGSFVNNLLLNKELSPEINIERFFSLS